MFCIVLVHNYLRIAISKHTAKFSDLSVRSILIKMAVFWDVTPCNQAAPTFQRSLLL
jgi:hypothetical protein